MKERQEWMKVGAQVLAIDKLGTITGMQLNTIDGTEYVYYIQVKIVGEKHAGQYHPNDVQEPVFITK